MRQRLRTLDELGLADLEAIRLVLRGGSVIDWHRLNFLSEFDAQRFMRALEVDWEDVRDRDRSEQLKAIATDYLKRNFDFPIPKPVARCMLPELLMLASSRGHRQLCACTILKVMHILYHLEARELLFALPISDQEVFQLVERKVYRVIGQMLAQQFPVVEFIGGRKNKDSLYTKLLSKPETVAAQIYDKVRFRIVTRDKDDIFPVLDHLMQEMFPFNYVIPGQSTNSLFDFRRYCERNDNLRQHVPKLQLSPDLEEEERILDNRFTAPEYRVVHFVVDMPIALPDDMLVNAPRNDMGRVIFMQTEFQIIDRDTEQTNELGEASHAAYKNRQKDAVIRRLKLGLEAKRQNRPSILPGFLRARERDTESDDDN